MQAATKQVAPDAQPTTQPNTQPSAAPAAAVQPTSAQTQASAPTTAPSPIRPSPRVRSATICRGLALSRLLTLTQQSPHRRTVPVRPKCKCSRSCHLKTKPNITLISAGCSITGDIIVDHGISCFGLCDGGLISTQGLLHVGEGGLIKGSAQGERVRIDGRVDGNVHARGSLEINGQVTGDIFYCGTIRLGPARGALNGTLKRVARMADDRGGTRTNRRSSACLARAVGARPARLKRDRDLPRDGLNYFPASISLDDWPLNG